MSDSQPFDVAATIRELRRADRGKLLAGWLLSPSNMTAYLAILARHPAGSHQLVLKQLEMWASEGYDPSSITSWQLIDGFLGQVDRSADHEERERPESRLLSALFDADAAEALAPDLLRDARGLRKFLADYEDLAVERDLLGDPTFREPLEIMADGSAGYHRAPSRSGDLSLPHWPTGGACTERRNAPDPEQTLLSRRA